MPQSATGGVDPRGAAASSRDTTRAGAVIRAYTEAVFRRAREPMPPLNFEINWADQPSRHKAYPGAERLPLPTALPELATLREVLTGTGLPAPQPWSLERLGTLLRLSYGVLDRRMLINWNQDVDKRAHFPNAVWGRGTASGGGMYPVEIYWIAGPSGPVLPGIYHYATGQHTLERLLTGDVTGMVRQALGGTATGDQFLLASIRFWKNSFKYNSFCYHVVTQDLGALLGSWDLLSQAIGAPLRRHLSFDATALDGLLGLSSDEESVFAVVPLDWNGQSSRQQPPGVDAPAPRPASDGSPRVSRPAFERSRTVLSFPQVVEVHRAAMLPTVPGTGAIWSAVPAQLPGVPIPLPAPELDQLDRPLDRVLRERKSSFGRFRRPPELTLAQLGTTLAAAAASRRYSADIKPGDREPTVGQPVSDGPVAVADAPTLTRLWVFANHVDGLSPGTYAYTENDHSLLPAGPAPDPDMSTFLQQQYFLTNYTMSQVGAVLAITGRVDAVLDAFGPRGYRILNAEIGTVAQFVYCATTAQGLGCGAVLGFDNVSMDAALRLESSDERTVLFILLGRQPELVADLTYQLC